MQQQSTSTVLNSLVDRANDSRWEGPGFDSLSPSQHNTKCLSPTCSQMLISYLALIQKYVHLDVRWSLGGGGGGSTPRLLTFWAALSLVSENGVKLSGGATTSGGPGAADQSLSSNNEVRASDWTDPDVGGTGDVEHCSPASWSSFINRCHSFSSCLLLRRRL